jgi:hypothetical protein
MLNKDFSVMLLEADDERSSLLDEIFRECDFCSKITRVNSVEEAKELLSESYKKYRVTPSLIIAYLVPEDTAFIKILKEHDVFRRIPLIGYGEYSSTADISTYYKEHINCFIVQPKTKEEFKDTFRNIFSFWGETVKLVHNEKLLV